MENPVYGEPQSLPATYDYRMYDRIWQRVSPDLAPYPELRDAPAAPQQMTAPADENSSDLAELPGAEIDPCCMGSQAQASVGVVAGFIDEELAIRRACLALSQRVYQENVRHLLRRIAKERSAAARQLKAAYYLITGTCHVPTITMEQPHWHCLQEALRACYHQEACSGLNYQRASDEADDLCLQKLFSQLSRQAYCRAEDVLTLLGTVIR